ncbi:hypothetical protein HID58_020855 [Brassica napus]|uniref:non-specific serine/threonine protein kinase n=3 Tax=Brassica TaxID=3705 RepID=A0ABQ8CUQ7_BRANA|nr:hypothetical protein HID58_020855 [Brassica napus]VDC64998.1 unnamed protein product [Brassica rapa]
MKISFRTSLIGFIMLTIFLLGVLVSAQKGGPTTQKTCVDAYPNNTGKCDAKQCAAECTKKRKGVKNKKPGVLLSGSCVLIALGMNLVSHFAYFVMQTLLKLVSDCSAVALNPSKKETASESPLKIALFSLAKMCSNHQICRQFVKSSELFPVIARLKHSP